jgi:hypothetical protein
MGIVSLFLIFTVFCLVLLSLLTYGTSRTDRASSLRSMEQTTAYYDACSAATDLCKELEEQMQSLSGQEMSEASFLRELKEVLPEDVTYDSRNGQLSFTIDFTDTKALYVELSIHQDDTETPVLSLSRWETRTTGDWNPDTQQNVYQKGELS